MNILCVNYEYPPIGGGGGAACKGLAETLVGLGDAVDVVTSGMKDLPAYEEVEGVRLHRVPCLRRHRHYTKLLEMMTQVVPAYHKALALVRQNDYAVNHTHFVFPTGLTSYWLWRKTGLPYVISVHGSDVPGYNPDRFRLPHLLLLPVWRRVVANAKCLITPSVFLKGLVEKHTDAKVEVVPYGIDFPTLPKKPKQKRILVVTRMFERKGVQFFIKALQGLDGGWEVCVAGDGPYLPTIRQMARDYRVPARFLGYVQGAKLLEYYQSATIFVFPSIQENFPVVLLEAMNAGCAVVTTTAQGCAEVVQDAAIKVAPQSPSALRHAVERLINDEQEVARLSRLSLQRIAELSPKRIAREHRKVFAKHARYELRSPSHSMVAAS